MLEVHYAAMFSGKLLYTIIIYSTNHYFCPYNIVQILKKNSILAHLDLSGCDIDAGGITLVSSSLGNKLCLQYLDLSGNMIDSKAAECLGTYYM